MTVIAALKDPLTVQAFKPRLYGMYEGFSAIPVPPPPPTQRTDDAQTLRGDPVRALQGRVDGYGATGIVTRLRWRRRATVHWTNDEITTVPIRHLTRIIDPRESS